MFLLPYIALADTLADIILLIRMFSPIIFLSISLILFHKNESISVLIGISGWVVYGVWMFITTGDGLLGGWNFVSTFLNGAIFIGMLITFAISAKISKKWKYSEIVIFFLADLPMWLDLLEYLY